MTLTEQRETKKFTTRQIANIHSAIAMMKTIPRRNIIHRLKDWVQGFDIDKQAPATCGTVACFGGWCAHWPEFRRQGVQPDANGAPTIPKLDIDWYDDVAERLFGDEDIFNTRGGHVADETFRFIASDHRVVMNRLQHLLKQATGKAA